MRGLRTRSTRLGAATAASVVLLGGGTLIGLAVSGGGAATGATLLSSKAPVAARGATITVTGSGKVVGTPDELTIEIGVSTKAPSAAAALDENNLLAGRLEAVFRHAGVPTKDLQTSNLDLNPAYDSSGAIDGYSVDDDLSVTMPDLAHAGAVIDAAAHAVGNDVTINGISFGISDQSALLTAARAAAMRDASAQAHELAAAAGAELGGIVTVDAGQQQVPPPIVYPFAALHASFAGTNSVPVQAGTTDVTVQVKVVYSLVD